MRWVSILPRAGVQLADFFGKFEGMPIDHERFADVEGPPPPLPIACFTLNGEVTFRKRRRAASREKKHGFGSVKTISSIEEVSR